jgi:hypothetical protein
MVRKSAHEPTVHEDREEIVNDDEEEEQDEERPKGSRIAEILQKPFDFISMMVQFIIYFMVRMATEGCMLPIPELEDNGEEDGEGGEDGDDEGEGEDEASGSRKRN